MKSFPAVGIGKFVEMDFAIVLTAANGEINIPLNA
jgi:hypothetical protein